MERDNTEMIPDSSPAPANPDEQSTVVDPTNAADQDTMPDGQHVGADNIREGRVGGVMGGPNQSQGEGQGG